MANYVVLFILPVTLTIPVANAESLRCGGKLASVGDTKADVIHICGEPLITDSFCEPNNVSTGPQGIQSGDNNIQNNTSIQTCTQVDVWTYNPGHGKFMTHLYFSQGQLQSIRYGSRVN